MEEVAKHNTEDDAWLVIDGAVYNISSFASMHPGGEQILIDSAGQDVTDDFWGLHREEVLNKFHDKLCVGYIDEIKKRNPDGVTSWGLFSQVLPTD